MLEPYLLPIIASNLLVVTLGILSAVIFHRVASSPEKTSNSFQLHHEKFGREFKLMGIGAVCMTLSYLFALVAVTASLENLFAVSGILAMPYLIITCYVFYRWVRRFQ
jgi:membrane protein implicated in regulation of membrane protease activity